MFERDFLQHPQPLIRRVYAYVAYRVGDGPDAEDVTSEVFARALKARATYDPRKGEPVAWLIGIARRVVAEEFARRAAAPTGRLVEVPGPSNLEEDLMRRATLAAAMSLLNERDAELIALSFGSDLSPAEIARLLKTRKNTIEVALHRASSRLAKSLLAAEADEFDDEAVSL